MSEPETTNAVMLDQAEVDAAEAAQDGQDNGGDSSDYIGRRPSSSGRETKRYRKCYLPPSNSYLPCPSVAYSGEVHPVCIHDAAFQPPIFLYLNLCSAAQPAR